MVIREIHVSSFKDKQITCLECGCTFVWERGEQAFYEAKNLLPPRRCPLCRKTRKITVIIRDDEPKAGGSDG